MHEKYIIAGQIYDNLPYTLQLYIIFSFENGSFESLGAVWYMCLKSENCCLKIFVEIRVGEKVH